MSQITIVFPHRGRAGTARVPWVREKTLRTYCAEYPLKRYGLIGKRSTHKVFLEQGEQVHLWYRPKEGDVLTFVSTRGVGV